jgi:hypothetical protein
MRIIELHRKSKPFAVLVSYESIGNLYSILFQDRYMRCEEMNRLEVRWFNDNLYLFKITFENEHGRVYEYKKFRKNTSHALRHNFLIRNQIIKGHYI